MKNALKHGTVVVPHAAHAAAEPDDFSVYEEYVRGFDDVPVLQDAVHTPPRRRPPPDFRRGERRDARTEARPDAYAAREENAAAHRDARRARAALRRVLRRRARRTREAHEDH
jgi:hypothetical protein